MDDSSILTQINSLIDEEHGLRTRLGDKELGVEQEHVQLQSLERQLDQCWDLLRQRRAKRKTGEDPDSAHVRSADAVEGYLQ